jgi:hypothetical protein
MVRFGRALGGEKPLPRTDLCAVASEVRAECVDHLKLTAPEPCR